nr:hypothetical protein [Gordonia oryzae]
MILPDGPAEILLVLRKALRRLDFAEGLTDRDDNCSPEGPV